MHVLTQLLKDIEDKSNTRYNILTDEEVKAITKALGCEFVIESIRVDK